MSASIAREAAVVTARTLGCAAIGIAGAHFGVLFLGALGFTGGMLASESAKKTLEFGVEKSADVLAELGLSALSERERDDPLEGIFRKAVRRALQSIHNPSKAASTSIAPSSPAVYKEWFRNWDKALENLPYEDYEQISSCPATRGEWLQRLSSALALLNAQGRMLDKRDKGNEGQPASGRYLLSFTPGQLEPPPDDLVDLVAAKLPTLLPPIFSALLRENRNQEAYKSYVIGFIRTFQDRYRAALEEIRALAEETNERTLQIGQETSQIPAIAENVRVLNAKIDTIAGPEFARTRIEEVGFAGTPRYFGPIRATLSPDEGRLSSLFLPTENDYKAKRVYRPTAADDVLGHLQQSGRALVRGVGASGKTVLAWLLGLGAAEQQRPAYYLDFARFEQMPPEIANAVALDLRQLAHPNTLFVLDNCHLEERVAKEVALGWEDIKQEKRPMLLLVARELRTSRGSPIDGLSIPTIPLRARQPEVLGVYRRLAGRHAGASEPPNPPPGALDDWVRTFGGDPESEETTTDLIAFSAAVIRRMTQLLRKNWTLTAQDAVEEIKEAYLAKLTAGEIQNLKVLCACQEIEVWLSEEALEDRSAALRNSTRKLGLVFHFQGERAGNLYRLAHPALANLILAAVSPSINTTTYRIQASLRSPTLGYSIVIRLAVLGRHDEARQVANQLLARPESLARMASLSIVNGFLGQLNKLRVSLPRNVETVLALPENRQQLLKCALDSQLHNLAYFLGYASKELKGINAALAEDLAKDENRQLLLKRALDSQLDQLAYFLGYASRELKGINAALAEDLAKDENRQLLLKRALDSQLDQLAYFLGYASRELKGINAALAEDLAKDENRQLLLKCALDTPLAKLAYFLDYASTTEELKGTYACLAEDLAKDENRQLLLKCALDTQLDSLANFLSYASRTAELKGIYASLVKELAKPDNRSLLLAGLEKQHLDAVVGFLNSEVACDLCVAITDLDLGRWDEARRTEETPNLYASVSFIRMAEQNGRPELSAVLAMRLIVDAIPTDWHRSGIGIHHLSHVLRSARGVSSEEIERFLNRVAPPLWVDEQIEAAATGGLAGALLALASTLDPEKYHWFQRKALLKRLLLELRNIQACPPESCAEVLSLLGSAYSLGVTLPRVKTGWPNAEKLAEVIRLRAPAADTTTIGHLQVQLWLGLHEMSRSRSDMVAVPQPEADRILELWAATLEPEDESVPPHVRIRNRRMVDWLCKCKAAEWSLVSPILEQTPQKG